MGATRTGVIKPIICVSVVAALKQGAPVLPRHENGFLPPPAFASMPQHTSASGLPPTYSEQPPFPSPHSPTVTDICVSCPLRRHHSRPWLSNSRINEYSEFGPRESWYLMPSLHSSCSVCSVRMYLAICGPHNVIPPGATSATSASAAPITFSHCLLRGQRAG